jgi:hypothetical protein
MNHTFLRIAARSFDKINPKFQQAVSSACHLLPRNVLTYVVLGDLVEFQRTARRYIPEDGSLHNHR